MEKEAEKTTSEQQAMSSAFWQKILDTSSNVPPGQDPAFWPIYVINSLLTREPRNSTTRPLMEKIMLALGISAYREFTDTSKGPFVMAAAMDMEINNRKQFELSDIELEMVSKLCNTPRYSISGDKRINHPPIPIDPERRVFNLKEFITQANEEAKKCTSSQPPLATMSAPGPFNK